MKVKQLIKILQKEKPDAEVLIREVNAQTGRTIYSVLAVCDDSKHQKYICVRSSVWKAISISSLLWSLGKH
jgi:hypothetical protein